MPRLCDAGAAHVAINVTGIEALVAASAAYGFTAVGEIVTIDAGPNRGSKVVYLADLTASPSSHRTRLADPRAACPAEAAVTASRRPCGPSS